MSANVLLVSVRFTPMGDKKSAIDARLMKSYAGWARHSKTRWQKSNTYNECHKWLRSSSWRFRHRDPCRSRTPGLRFAGNMKCGPNDNGKVGTQERCLDDGGTDGCPFPEQGSILNKV